jgi:hypothetical protein
LHNKQVIGQKGGWRSGGMVGSILMGFGASNMANQDQTVTGADVAFYY